MGKRRLSSITGWLIILGHFGLIALILLYLDSYLNASQKMQVILSLCPVTAIYLIAVVRSFLAKQRQFDQGEPVNGNMVGISILFPAAIISFLAYLILRYPSSIAGDVSSLQTWTAASEVAFAGTVGLIVEDLFPSQKPEDLATPR
jgi:cytochrome bd-type quinol oxidase subunit 2